MPFTKCKWYETDGTPVKGGCKRGDCGFIHPSNPSWAKARDSNKNGGGAGGRGGTSSSAGWGAPPTSTRSGWDASSSGWGDAGSSWSEPPKASANKGSSWADPESSPWADASKAKGSESSTSTGGAWGDAPAADSSNNGWGWGDSTNAESAESSGWGGSTGEWGASEGTEKISEASGTGNTGESGVSVIDRRGQDQSVAPAGKVTPRPQPEDVEMQDVPPPSATSHRSSFSMARPGSPADTDATSRTRIRSARHRAKEPVGPAERFKTWELTVKAVSVAVRTYGDLVNAEADRDRYKRLQNSSQFSRVAAKGREMLDAGRKDSEEKVLRLSKEFKRQMDVLENLPEMSAKFLNISFEVDEAQIVNYIREIKEWIGDVRPLLVTVMASAKAPESSPSKTRALSVEDGQIEDDHPSPSKRRYVSPEPNSGSDILSRVYRAEQIIDEIATELHLKTQSSNADRAVDETVEMIRAARVDDPSSSDPVVHMSNKLDELGNTLAREAEKTAAIMTRQQEMEQELTAQKEERQRNLQYRAQYQQQAADMQKSLDSNLTLLKRMELQMQQVLLHREAPQPFILSDAARTQIETNTRKTISEEVEPIITDFRLAVERQISGQHGQFCQDLWQKLEPSLQLTKQIYNWLESQLQKQVA